MKSKVIQRQRKSQSGFVAAEFLFSFVLVISCGLIVFALTFSLMTIEVAQYITWSSARSYSSGNISKDDSVSSGQTKFKNLAANFPLLTKEDSNWFALSSPNIGGSVYPNGDYDSGNKLGDETRHPWSGATAKLQLVLFKSLKIPFLGKIVNDDSAFDMNLSSFILRNPSVQECLIFSKDRFNEIKHQFPNVQSDSSKYVPNEDNGC